MIFESIDSIIVSSKNYPYLYKPKHKKHLTEKEYKNIMRLFLKKLIKRLIISGIRISLPSKTGDLQFVKYKSKYYNDYNLTRKKGPGSKLIKGSNASTNGYWFKFKWYKARQASSTKMCATFKHRGNYKIDLTRPNVRPNKSNNSNPEVSAIPFFRQEGWMSWQEEY